MFTCAECQVFACYTGEPDRMPRNCPMLDESSKKVIEESCREYKDDNLVFARQAALIESKGYCQSTRVQEVIHFCREMGYQKIGIAFCNGLRREAAVFAKILRSHGFEVVSVTCKNGSVPKSTLLKIKNEEQCFPGRYEAMCNPVGQAMLLNHAQTHFNVAVGLCVGHDSLFFKYSQAPVTVLIAKDRVLAHNPAGALYCAEGFYRRKVFPE